MWEWIFRKDRSTFVEVGIVVLATLVILVSGYNPIAIVSAACVLFFLMREHFLRRRENACLESRSLASGSLSEHLAPKLRRILEGSAVFYVTENNASALLSWRAARWRRFLKEALKHGSTVNYILTDANEADKRKLAQLKSELESGADGRIQFCFFTFGLPDNDEDRKLRDSLRTFHPVLVEDSAHQRVMWIEGYHPLRNEEWAYHIEFLLPEDAVKDKRYDEYKKLLDGIIGKYGTGGEAHA